MSDKIRIGIIGTSWFADFFYLPILKNHPNAVLSTICGRNQARGQELASKYGIAKYYPDYQQMIAAGDLDAVIVYTPEDLHYPVTMAALAAGLHVICEKPLALSAAQAREMYEKAEAMRVKHMVSFTNRGIPYFRYFKQLLEEAYLGTPYHAHFEWLPGWNPDAPKYAWYFDPERAHGTVSELGGHIFDLARWYLGEVSRVSATLGSYVKRPGTDGGEMRAENDAAFVLLEFASGVRATVHLSLINRAAEGLQHTGEVVLMHGQEGTLELHGNAWAEAPHGDIMGFQRGMKRAEALIVPDGFFGSSDRSSMFKAFHEQSLGPRLFIDAILNDLPITPSFYDGYKTQQIIEAALESDKTGYAINIDHSL